MTTTAYQFSDTLPKDTGGDKFIAWVNEDGGSDLHFVLPRGIGRVTAGSKLFGSLGIGTHTGLSGAGLSGVGVMVGGYTLRNQAASLIDSTQHSGKFIPVQVSHYGEMMVSGVARSLSFLTGSVNTISTASYIFGYEVSASNPSAGAYVFIRNGANTKLHERFSANETTTRFRESPVGGWYIGDSSGITVEISMGSGAASVTLFTNRDAQ